MREITSHAVNPANESIKIHVTDQPGKGGACHRYEVTGFDTSTNPSHTDAEGYTHSKARDVILFQNGPPQECGVNGLTHEVFLAVLIDRLQGFQSGPFACADNQEALDHLLHVKDVLQRRTRERMDRGVEGTHTV